MEPPSRKNEAPVASSQAPRRRSSIKKMPSRRKVRSDSGDLSGEYYIQFDFSTHQPVRRRLPKVADIYPASRAPSESTKPKAQKRRSRRAKTKPVKREESLVLESLLDQPQEETRAEKSAPEDTTKRQQLGSRGSLQSSLEYTGVDDSSSGNSESGLPSYLFPTSQDDGHSVFRGSFGGLFRDNAQHTDTTPATDEPRRRRQSFSGLFQGTKKEDATSCCTRRRASFRGMLSSKTEDEDCSEAFLQDVKTAAAMCFEPLEDSVAPQSPLRRQEYASRPQSHSQPKLKQKSSSRRDNQSRKKSQSDNKLKVDRRRKSNSSRACPVEFISFPSSKEFGRESFTETTTCTADDSVSQRRKGGRSRSSSARNLIRCEQSTTTSSRPRRHSSKLMRDPQKKSRRAIKKSATAAPEHSVGN